MPILVFYNIIEIVLFYRFEKYNWPLTLFFRIVFLLHDIGYLIFYATVTPLDARYSYYGFDVASCVFFAITFAIGIAILVVYSKFPKYGCGACCLPKVIMVQMPTDVATMATATGAEKQQAYVIQNPNHRLLAR